MAFVILLLFLDASLVSDVASKCASGLDGGNIDNEVSRCPYPCQCATSSQFGGLTVDCSSRHLTHLPGLLPAQTTALLMSDNVVSTVSDVDLDSCTKLQLLDISRNGLSRLHRGAFSSTTNLKQLYLNNNNLWLQSVAPATFANLRQLKVLHIHNNIWQNATGYPDAIFSNLSSLRDLSVDAVPGVPFSRGFSFLTNLHNLSVIGGMTTLENDTFAAFAASSVTTLKVQSEGLYELEAMSFAHFRTLETLDLSDTTRIGLANVSRAWWGLQFTRIKTLLLANMEEKTVGAVSLTRDFFTHLDRTNISRLGLDRNNIVDMEPLLSSYIPGLVHLDLSYNRFSNVGSIAIDCWKLRNVRYLDVCHQTKRYVQPRDDHVRARRRRSIEGRLHGASRNSAEGEELENKFGTDDEVSAEHFFFDVCRTPPLPPCSTISRLTLPDQKIPLPNYGTWCLPLGPKVEVLKLSESLDVDLKNLPSLLVLGGSYLKVVEYRQNGIEQVRGPLVFSQPVRGLSLDLSDNRLRCLAPDLLEITFKLGTDINELILNGNNLGEQMELDQLGRTFTYVANMTRLNLAANTIKKLPVAVFRKLPHMEVLNLSRNSLRQVEFDFDHMKQLKHLDLSYNLLSDLTEPAMSQLQTLMNAPSAKLNVNLLGNPIQCSCATLHFLRWIESSRKQLISVDNYTCLFGEKEVQFSKLANVILVQLDFECSKSIAVIASASLVAFVVVLLAGSVCCYRYRWELRYCCLKLAQRGRRYQLLVDDPERYTYDAFVVYSADDSRWIRNELLPHLEEEDSAIGPPLKLCVHERDFSLGEYIIDNIWSKMEKSRKVVLVISRNFVDSNYCNYEMNLARTMSVEQARNVFVPVLLEPVRVEDISDCLRWIVRKLTYIEWPTCLADREEFWQKLRDCIDD